MAPTYSALNTYLYVNNPEKSAAFYQALGFPLARHFPEMNVYSFTLGASNFVVGPATGEGAAIQAWLKAKPYGVGTMLMPATKNVDAVHVAAQTAGADVVEAPTNQVWGSRTLTIRDPDGYMLMFEQDLNAPARKPATKKPNVAAKSAPKAAKRATKVVASKKTLAAAKAKPKAKPAQKGKNKKR